MSTLLIAMFLFISMIIMVIASMILNRLTERDKRERYLFLKNKEKEEIFKEIQEIKILLKEG